MNSGRNPPASIEGTYIGNYQVLRRIGSGAFGDVYFGRHHGIDKAVAIKVLDAELSSNEEIVSRFNAEARAVNLINHPNIVQVFDFGLLPDGRHYIVMELLNGRELSELIEVGAPFSIRETLKILKPICQALEAAHKRGIIHRDLKPDNIMVMEDEEGGQIVKILDFGIAKLADSLSPDSHRTSVGVILGTPLYMSPEQASGSLDEIGPHSDVYALAVITYRMLSDRFPIDGDSPRAVLYKQVTEEPRSLSTVTRGLSPAICDVVHKALEKSPKKRTASAMQFYRELEEVASPLDPDLVAQLIRTSEIRETMPGQETGPGLATYSPPKGGMGLTFWLVLLLLFAAAGGTLWLIWDRAVELLSPPPEPEPVVLVPPAPVESPMSDAKPVQSKPFRLHLDSRDGVAEVDVYVEGVLILSARKTPVDLPIARGGKVRLVARRPGFTPQEDQWTMDSDLDITLVWKKK